jgi:hypothetical protein
MFSTVRKRTGRVSSWPGSRFARRVATEASAAEVKAPAIWAATVGELPGAMDWFVGALGACCGPRVNAISLTIEQHFRLLQLTHFALYDRLPSIAAALAQNVV